MPDPYSHDYDGQYDPHIGLAHSVICEVAMIGPDHSDYDDCLQVARMAIWNAQRNYCDKQGAAFSTYACKAIRHALFRWKELDYRHGFTRVGERSRNRKIVSQPKSLNFDLSEGGDELGDIIADKRIDLKLSDNQEWVWSLLSALANKDTKLAMVVYGRFFLGLSLRKIGERMGGVCREYVRQLEAEALEWLRHRAERM